MIFLAQLTPEMLKGMPTWLICLGASLWITDLALNLVKKFKGKSPTPPNETLSSQHELLKVRVDGFEKTVVEIKAGMMGKEWFVNVDANIAEIKNALKTEQDKNEQHISMRSGKIYEKIDEVSRDLRQEMQVQSDRRDEQITGLQKTIEDLPEKILNLLEKIKALAK